MSGRRLNSQAQEMVLNLLEYFENEKKNGGPVIPITNVQERVAGALKISGKTIRAIKRRKENNPIRSSPGKSRPRLMPKTIDLPEGVKMTVRDTLYNMYKERKHVTIKTINQELRSKEVVYLGKTSLRSLLTELGFKYKNEENRRVLTEKTAIAAKRGEFLRKFQENKHSSLQRDVVFLDETWIYSKVSKRKSWPDQSVNSARKLEGYDGKRFIILHAGNSKGFIKDADLLFASKS